MKKLISMIVLTVATFGAVTIPTAAHAADPVTYVDSFTTADPSLGDDCMGNGITFVGDVDVAWTVNGTPYSYTPQSRTLWLPDGFDGTVTATSTNGVPLVEIDTGRQAQSLSWHHTVDAVDCSRPVKCDTTQADALAVELAVTKAKVERQRAIINRLRAKLHR